MKNMTPKQKKILISAISVIIIFLIALANGSGLAEALGIAINGTTTQDSPTAAPTPTSALPETPTKEPTVTPIPTVTPTPAPTPESALAPTNTPRPTAAPTPTDTPIPTVTPTPAPTPTEAPTPALSVQEDGSYTSKDEVALYIHTYNRLPKNFIPKAEAERLGWVSSKGNLWDVTDHCSIGGDRFGNYEGLLPKKNGRTWYECDINYNGGRRGTERILYSNDGLIYYTDDHYETFTRLY